MHTTIMVIAEQRQGELKEVSLEAVAAARSIAKEGEKVIAAVLGSGMDAVAQTVATSGVDQVLVVDSELLLNYTYDSYKHALIALIEEAKPDVVVGAYTSQGMDLYPGLAAFLQRPIVADSISMQRKDGGLMVTRQLYGGKIETEYSVPFPCIISVRQAVHKPLPAGNAAEIRKVEVDFSNVRARTSVKGYETPPKEDVDIEKAKIVISVGRGIEKQENLPVFEELVKNVDGSVLAGSRPIIDNGWLPKGRQVGVSGKTVKPKLYIALGISGAIQHLSGMTGSEFIVAVNRDKDAPIFKIANIGIVDDIFKFVPALVSELKKS